MNCILLSASVGYYTEYMCSCCFAAD